MCHWKSWCQPIISIATWSERLISRLYASSCKRPMQVEVVPPLTLSCFSSCNSCCSSKTLCDAQIAYREWVDEELPQARVQACHQFLRAFLVTGGCEARSNA